MYFLNSRNLNNFTYLKAPKKLKISQNSKINYHY